MERTALVKGAVCPNRFFLCKLKPIGLCADFDVVLYECLNHRDMGAIATYSITTIIKYNILCFTLDNRSMLCYHLLVIDSMRASGENPGQAIRL